MEERNINIRDTPIGCLSLMHWEPGIEPATEEFALDWELNPSPFCPQADALTTKEDQSGQIYVLKTALALL